MVRSLLLPDRLSRVSVANCSTVAARIGAALEEALAIDTDGGSVPQIVSPVGDHLDGLAPPFELARHFVGDTALEGQVARLGAPGAAHQPARRFERLLDVIAEVDDAGDY